MKFFHETCSQFKLGVNFSKDKCFKTFNSKTGISIWLYEPQGDYDKAPTKNEFTSIKDLFDFKLLTLNPFTENWNEI